MNDEMGKKGDETIVRRTGMTADRRDGNADRA